jgi:hypothetical protein
MKKEARHRSSDGREKEVTRDGRKKKWDPPGANPSLKYCKYKKNQRDCKHILKKKQIEIDPPQNPSAPISKKKSFCSSVDR